jgi:hypothetical protein
VATASVEKIVPSHTGNLPLRVIPSAIAAAVAPRLHEHLIMPTIPVTGIAERFMGAAVIDSDAA